jgi:hypothetical protein
LAALRRVAVGLPVLVSLGGSFWYLNLRPPSADSQYAPDQVWYGPFMAHVRARHALDGAVILDGGVPNNAGFVRYNPIARFLIEDAERRGEHMSLLSTTESLPTDASVLSCDPQMRRWLTQQRSFTPIHADGRCVFGRLAAAHRSETGKP